MRKAQKKVSYINELRKAGMSNIDIMRNPLLAKKISSKPQKITRK